MDMIAQIAHVLEEELNVQAERLAKETGFIQRVRKLTGADIVQELIFAWWEEPQITLDGLAQVGERREVSMTGSGINQRFNEKSAKLMEEMLQRLTAQHLHALQDVPVPLLNRFSEVFIEDSSVITLPEELVSVWRGCGGSHGTSEAAVKLFVRWEVKKGALYGPCLRAGRHSDGHGPLSVDALPDGSLSVADLGFFSQERFRRIARRGEGKQKRRYVVTRWQPGTALFTRTGHRIRLAGVLPQQVGERVQMGALLGVREKLLVRVLMERVPPEVAAHRQQRLREAAQDHGREVSQEALELAHWTILLTNAPQHLLSFDEVLIIVRLRWQIERLFRLWKQYGRIDEWRSKKPWRVLTELYGKLSAMVIQQWLITAGCWHDPKRSLVKAAQALRREANRIMVALYEGGLESTLRSILRTLRSGCQVNTRLKEPSTAQLLLGWAPIWQPEETRRKKSKKPPKGRARKAVAILKTG
jgi:hypothetical protein